MNERVTLQPYIIELLAAMLRQRTNPLHFHVIQIGPRLHVIAEPHGGLTIVDSQRRIASEGNPACECRVPLDFPGRFEPEHYFEVRWIDCIGDDHSFVAAAPSPTWARLAARAPKDADVQVME